MYRNSYYGFGMVMPGTVVTGGDNKLLYNGQSEWQNDYSNMPDYYETPARNYDAEIGRFIGTDPMAESSADMSTYHYAGDNPIMMNDPSGNNAAPTNVGGTDLFSFKGVWDDGNDWHNPDMDPPPGEGGSYDPSMAVLDQEATQEEQYQEVMAASTSIYHAGDGTDDDPTTGSLSQAVNAIVGGTASFAISLENAPGFKGNGNFSATFKITGNDGSNISSLQIINTVYTSARGGVWYGKCNWEESDGTTYVGFVDGGPNAGSLSQNVPLDLEHPYYYTPGELNNAKVGKMSWSGNTGHITFTDDPAIQNNNSDVHFEMIVVGTNYEDSKQDYVIGDYRFAWKSGVMSSGANFQNYNSVSENALRIINYDYPRYKFYDGN